MIINNAHNLIWFGHFATNMRNGILFDLNIWKLSKEKEIILRNLGREVKCDLETASSCFFVLFFFSESPGYPNSLSIFFCSHCCGCYFIDLYKKQCFIVLILWQMRTQYTIQLCIEHWTTKKTPGFDVSVIMW